MKPSSRSKRPYVLKVRGDQVAATRARIIDATVALHEEVGPRRTSIKAIAERAGVERLTVYRHFPDERAVLAACSACWAGRHPPPDPAGWQGESDPAARTRGALTALYRYFEDNRGMLTQVHRDLAELPALAEVTAPFLGYLAQVADDLTAAWNPSAPAAAPVSAVVHHLVRFETWALLHGAGWSNPQAVSLLLAWVEAVSSGRGSRA